MKNLKNIIEENCRVLGISVPALCVKPTSFFTTETTRAALVVPQGDLRKACIALNVSFVPILKNDEFQAVLTLSHECRHFWQIVNEEFDEYQTSDELTLSDYNDQIAEVDAWAWAAIATSHFFDRLPDYISTFGKSLADKIMKRAEEILDEEII